MDLIARQLVQEFQLTKDSHLWNKILNLIQQKAITISELFKIGVDAELLKRSFWAVSSTITKPEEKKIIDASPAGGSYGGYVPTFSWWAGSFVPVLPRDKDPEVLREVLSRTRYTLEKGEPTQYEIELMKNASIPQMYARIGFHFYDDKLFRLVFGGTDDTSYEKEFKLIEELEKFIEQLPPTIQIEWLRSKGFHG